MLRKLCGKMDVCTMVIQANIDNKTDATVAHSLLCYVM